LFFSLKFRSLFYLHNSRSSWISKASSLNVLASSGGTCKKQHSMWASMARQAGRGCKPRPTTVLFNIYAFYSEAIALAQRR